jgi:hypothetical protein
VPATRPGGQPFIRACRRRATFIDCHARLLLDSQNWSMIPARHQPIQPIAQWSATEYEHVDALLSWHPRLTIPFPGAGQKASWTSGPHGPASVRPPLGNGWEHGQSLLRGGWRLGGVIDHAHEACIGSVAGRKALLGPHDAHAIRDQARLDWISLSAVRKSADESSARPSPPCSRNNPWPRNAIPLTAALAADLGESVPHLCPSRTQSCGPHCTWAECPWCPTRIEVFA